MVGIVTGLRQYADLLIVGYFNCLSDTMLPARDLPPVCRIKGTDSYLIAEKKVEEGVFGEIIAESEYQRLIFQNELTPLKVTFDSKPEHCLWIDEDRMPHYEDYMSADIHLDKLVNEYLRKGKNLFEEGRFSDARSAYARAYALDVDSVEAVAGFITMGFILDPDSLTRRLTWKVIYQAFAREDPERVQTIADLIEKMLLSVE